jgi:transcriptional regulator with XRE-family HTH domain
MSLEDMGAAVNSVRRVKHISIREMARRAETNPNTIINLERTGAVTLKTLLKIAKALRIKASDLVRIAEKNHGKA